MGLQPGAQARVDLVARGAGQLLVGEDAQARLVDLLARLELRDRIALPADRAVVREHERGVGRGGEAVGPRLDLARQRLLGGVAQGLRLGRCPPADSGTNMEAVQVTDMLAFDGDVAGWP